MESLLFLVGPDIVDSGRGRHLADFVQGLKLSCCEHLLPLQADLNRTIDSSVGCLF